MGTAELQGDLWGSAPDGWAMIQEPKHKPLFEAMAAAARIGEGSHVLDAGCGSGGASIVAASLGAKVSGLDAAEGLLRFARERLPDGDFRLGDIQDMPFEDDTFSAVVAPNSLQYSADRVATLREFARVCQPGGRIAVGLFSAPDKVAFAPLFGTIGATLPEPPPGAGPFELSIPNVLESLFKEAGLTVVESGETDCPFQYENFEQFWRANASAGPVQGALRVVGEAKIQAALQTATAPFTRSDGSILIEPNYFKFVVAAV